MNNSKIKTLSFCIYLVVSILRRTYRIQFRGLEHRDAARAAHQQGSYCIALWHEYLLAGILAHAGQKMAPLASLSKDGEIVTRVMERLGYNTVRGSSNRGGPQARDELSEKTNAGWFTAITVDGPRGPRRRVKGGIIDIARRTQVQILPMIATADREWVLVKSWDHFKIPKPFARIIVQYAPPIVVSPDTQGLAFGNAKQAVRSGLELCEKTARSNLDDWIL